MTSLQSLVETPENPVAYGVTGPRFLTEDQERRVADWIFFQLMDAEPPASRLVSGCQVGVDTLGVRAAQRARVPVLLTLPRVRTDEVPGWKFLSYNASLHLEAVSDFPSGLWIIESANVGRDAGEGYNLRNDLTIACSSVLLACPKTPEEEFRGSGTWSAIRRAKKAGMEIRYCPLDGSEMAPTLATARLF